MKKIYLFVLVLALGLTISENCFAQNQIKITYARPGLNQLYLSNLWDIELTNLTNDQVEFYLYGTLKEKKAGLIATGTTVIMKLNSKEKKKFKVNELPQTPNISYPNSDPRFKEALMRKGSLPNGSYEVCVVAKEKETNDEISLQECFDQDIVEIFEKEITLLTPDNNETLDPSIPITFSWTPLADAKAYKIRIVEILGNESPENAMLKNKAFFEKEDIRTTSFQYSSSAPKFVDGKKYAWQVSSSNTNSGTASFMIIAGGGEITVSLTPIEGENCCFQVSINSSENIPFNSFQLSVSNNMFQSITPVTGTVNPVVPPSSNNVIWVNENGNQFQTGISNIGTVCFENTNGNNHLEVKWSTNGGIAFAPGTDNLESGCSQQPNDCNTDVLILNTGWNYVNNSVYNTGEQDVFWTLIDAPTDNGPVNLNGPAWVIDNHNAWNSPYNNSKYISAFSTPGSNRENYGIESLPAYVFQKQICVTEISDLYFDLNVYVDNAMWITFVDQSGNWISDLGELPTELATNFTNSHNFVTSVTNVTPGTYFIRLAIRNDDIGTPMGVNLQGTVTGSANSFIRPECCIENISSISGFKFRDENCNGNGESEPHLQGWTIQLSGNGQSQSATTDVNGYYIFTGLPAGTYTITEIMQTGWLEGPTGTTHTVTIGDFQAINNINFGNIQPCDCFIATAEQGEGNCCGSISLIHPTNTLGVFRIRFVPLDGNTFILPTNTSNVLPGWSQINSTNTEYIIRRPGGIPSGSFNNFFNFCLSTMTSPQRIKVQWQNNAGDEICADTIEIACDIPCVSFSNSEVECNAGNFDVTFQFTNNSHFPISVVDITKMIQNGSEISFTSTLNINPIVVPGGTSDPIQFTLNNIEGGDLVCLPMLFKSPDGCCRCPDTLCIEIPTCICDKVDATISGSTLDCCYWLSLNNDYLGSFFTNVKLTALDGVNFSYYGTDDINGWSSFSPYPSNEINLQYEDATGITPIPLGTFQNVVRFCLTGYESSPQRIKVEWINNNGVVCVDTLITECQPPPIPTDCVQLINTTIECLSDGSFEYSFDVKNNSPFPADGLAFRTVSPVDMTINPINITFLTPVPPVPNPGHISTRYSVIFDNVSPGSEICFQLALYKGTYDGNSINDCCFDTLCITLPLCPTSCNCDGGTWNFLQNKIEFTSGGTPRTNPFECDASFNVDAGTPVAFSPSYSCNGEDCDARYTYSLNGGVPTGFMASPFTIPSVTTTTNVRIYAYCGDKICDSCDVTLTPSPSCLDLVRITDLKCIGKNNLGGFNYTLNLEINNPTGSPVSSLFISVSCGTIIGLPLNIPSGGIFTYPVTISTNNVSITSCCINYDNKPCEDKICFDFPTCPPPPPCECGEWKKVKENSISYGGNDYLINCFDEKVFEDVCVGEDFIFNGIYGCSGTCNAEYKWVLTDLISNNSITGGPSPMPITVSPPDASKYKLTIYAECDGQICDSCAVNFITKKCDDKCKCGEWDKGTITFTDKNGITGNKPLECNEYYGIIKSGTSISINRNFICDPKDCKAVYNYKLVDTYGNTVNSTSGLPITGTNVSMPITFTPMVSGGMYYLSITPVCGNEKCKPCEIKIEIEEKVACKCEYISATITINGAPPQKFQCGSGITQTIYSGDNVEINPGIFCDPKECLKKTFWEVTGPSGFTPVTGNNFPIQVTPTIGGNYQVTSYIVCGTDTCRCITKFKVQQKQECDCGTSPKIQIVELGGVIHNLSCLQTALIPYLTQLSITPQNVCNSSSCQDSIKYLIEDLQTGAFVTNGTLYGSSPSPINIQLQSFAGYTVKFTSYCKGKKCECMIYIRTKPDMGCNCKLNPTATLVVNGIPKGNPINCNGGFPDDAYTGETISVNFNNFGFANPNCNITGSGWSLTPPSGIPNPMTLPISFSTSIPGPYLVTYWIASGKDTCKCSAAIKVIKKPIGPIGCTCIQGYWSGSAQIHGVNIGCQQNGVPDFAPGYLNVSGPTYICSPPPGSPGSCKAQHTYSVWKSGSQVYCGNGNSFNNYYFTSSNYPYEIKFSASCNGQKCNDCIVTIKVKSIFWPSVSLGDIATKKTNVFPTIFNPTGSTRPDFKWEIVGSSGKEKYLKLIEVNSTSGMNNLLEMAKELTEKEPVFEVLAEKNELIYPKDSPDLKRGSYYIWVVYESDENSANILQAGLFKAGSTIPGKEITNCNDCTKECSTGRCWKIGDKCFCF